MALRKPQEEPLYFDAAAGQQQRLQLARTEGAQAFEEHVGLVERLTFGHFIEQFQDGTLRR